MDHVRDLVGYRVQGLRHRPVIHTRLRSSCGGPPTAIASAEELQQRIDHVRNWAITGRRS